MSTEQVENSIRQANPVPNIDDPPLGAVDAATLLALLEKESGTMTTTKPRPEHTDRGRSRARGIRIALASFVAVLIVGAVALLSTRGGEPEPAAPPTTPAPTTVAPTTTVATVADDGRATVEAALAAYTEGRIDDFVALIAPGADLRDSPATRPNDRIPAEMVARRAAVAAAIGERYEVTGCEFAARLSCTVAISDDLTRGVGLEPFAGEMTFLVADGQIVEWKIVRDSVFDIDHMTAATAFGTWHEATYPEDPMLLWPGTAGYFWLRATEIEKIVGPRIDEYLGTLG